ncbi:hypothetical protein DSAG12_01385 [Promethearchaeum syntrophicum]|uniref:Uncharacterized protein n=1 Tax=Promethearchaeum syntrophicum TaxID=2594042 RepID=A0A5B9D8U1_9ARCH|nr:hypothetical protein [Candidatus Prometheoarchaeum syntrophicum]QEE15559.1 hypothetical protein DSAG12_01385 [Candidatus Prometheoarchaeum syntrophicum]
MNQYSKIIPKWGKNRYNLWSCESLEYQDSEKEKIILSLSSDPKRVSFRQIRKLNKIACMDCKHYITGQCPFPKEEIKQNSRRYKILKPKCSVCSMPLSFHNFLLQKYSTEKLCIMCLQAKINGSLEEKKKKNKKTKIWEILEGIGMVFIMVISTAEVFLDGVFDLGDYVFIGLFSLFIVGYLSYFFIKRRNKKKYED